MKLTARSWNGPVMVTEAQFLIGPRTGAPSRSEPSYATVAAPIIREADMAAKVPIIEGKVAFESLDGRYRAVVTDQRGQTEVVC